MVKQIFDDLQKLKCYSCDPIYPLKLKDLFMFYSKSWYAKIEFLKTIHIKKVSWKETYDIDLWLHI